MEVGNEWTATRDQDEVSCYRPDDSTPIHVNIIHIDARTIRTFMHYCTGR
jgi:hypothetical protein